MHSWQKLRITTLQIQHHLWTVSLLMQDHLGQSHQVQQITHPRVVWISPLPLDAGCGKPGTNFHGGIRISVCWQIPVHPASCMHGLVCVSVSMSYFVCTPLFREVQCEWHSTCTIMCLPSTTQFWHWGEFFQCDLYGGSLVGGEVDQRLFGLSTAAPLWNKIPK